MLTAERNVVSDVLQIKISGTIDEHANLVDVIGTVTGKVEFDLKDISHINSVGVKLLMRYLHEIRDAAAEFKFLNCSPAFVEQMNLAPTFTCGGEVVSICLPFYCEKCSAELTFVTNVRDLDPEGNRIPEAKCEKVGCEAVFDDLVEEYLAFLRRN